MNGLKLEDLRLSLDGFRMNGRKISSAAVIQLLVERVDRLTMLVQEAGIAHQCERCSGVFLAQPWRRVIRIGPETVCANCAGDVFSELDEGLELGAVHQVAAHIAVLDAVDMDPEQRVLWARERRLWITHKDIEPKVRQIKAGKR